MATAPMIESSPSRSGTPAATYGGALGRSMIPTLDFPVSACFTCHRLFSCIGLPGSVEAITLPLPSTAARRLIRIPGRVKALFKGTSRRSVSAASPRFMAAWRLGLPAIISALTRCSELMRSVDCPAAARADDSRARRESSSPCRNVRTASCTAIRTAVPMKRANQAVSPKRRLTRQGSFTTNHCIHGG